MLAAILRYKGHFPTGYTCLPVLYRPIIFFFQNDNFHEQRKKSTMDERQAKIAAAKKTYERLQKRKAEQKAREANTDVAIEAKEVNIQSHESNAAPDPVSLSSAEKSANDSSESIKLAQDEKSTGAASENDNESWPSSPETTAEDVREQTKNEDELEPSNQVFGNSQPVEKIVPTEYLPPLEQSSPPKSPISSFSTFAQLSENKISSMLSSSTMGILSPSNIFPSQPSDQIIAELRDARTKISILEGELKHALDSLEAETARADDLHQELASVQTKLAKSQHNLRESRAGVAAERKEIMSKLKTATDINMLIRELEGDISFDEVEISKPVTAIDLTAVSGFSWEDSVFSI